MSEIEVNDLGSRNMPDFVKRGLIKVNGGQVYLKAPYRVLWMREEHPDWSILTSIEFADYEGGFAVVKATILDGTGRILATAHSEEKRGALPFVKKAETGAIARALALCGYGTQFGEFQDEDFADSPQAAPKRAAAAPGATKSVLNESGAQCPYCKAPDGKMHVRSCPTLTQAAA